jgi:AcrR family transcriptional regulator
MPRRPLSQDQIATFRQRAVDAATGLFAAHGVEGVSMRRLAAEIGCSTMTPYRYFEDHDELFAMVRADCFRRFGDRQRDAINGDYSARERLIRLKDAYIGFALDEPDAYRIMFQLKQRPAGSYPELARESQRSFAYFREAVADAVADGVLHGDPLTHANLFWATAHGLVSLHLSGKLVMGRSIHELADQILPQT